MTRVCRRSALAHLEKLVQYQEPLSWKQAPFLKERYLKSSHFNKMKVAHAKNVYSRTTAAALEYLSKLPQGEPGMKTTVFFFFGWLTNGSSCALRGTGKLRPKLKPWEVRKKI